MLKTYQKHRTERNKFSKILEMHFLFRLLSFKKQSLSQKFFISETVLSGRTFQFLSGKMNARDKFCGAF